MKKGILMLIFQNEDGQEVARQDVPEGKHTLYLLYGNLQRIGETLGLEGRFRINYGLSDINRAVESLKEIAGK